MLFIALLAATGADPALVARGDELNARYVECLFAVSREAQAQGMEEGRFASRLASSCESERMQLHEVLVAVRIQRGSTPGQAEAEWIKLEEQGRASVVRAYRLGRELSK